MRSGGVARKAEQFGEQVGKKSNKDFCSSHAKKEISRGTVANRAANFGGNAVATEVEDENAFSSQNARKLIQAGRVASQRSLFASAGQDQEKINPAEFDADDGMSAKNAAALVQTGSVAAMSSNFDLTSPAPENTPENAHSGAPSFEAKLTAFYQKYNPDNMHKLPVLLEKYAGKEKALNKQLEKKYGYNLDNFEEHS